MVGGDRIVDPEWLRKAAKYFMEASLVFTSAGDNFDDRVARVASPRPWSTDDTVGKQWDAIYSSTEASTHKVVRDGATGLAEMSTACEKWADTYTDVEAENAS